VSDARLPRVLVVQHQDSCPPALFGQWLTEAGVALDVCRPDLGAAVPSLTRAGRDAYDGLLVLGGDMTADADTAHAWLPVVRQRVAEAAAGGLPSLGICLGHQVAGLALGATVERNPHGTTIGLRQVDWEPAVIFDPLLSAIAGEDRALWWNDDVVVELPEGAEVLATGLDGAVQAARFAPTVWGVQFHPEADSGLVRRWAESDAVRLGRLGLDADELVESVLLAQPELVRTWRPLAESFATLVRGRAAATDQFGHPGR